MAVNKGYRHIWNYRGVWDEKKIGKGRWKVTFRASKGKKSNTYGNYPKGFKIVWGFKNVQQKAIKTGKGQYQTILTGIKYVKKVPKGGGKKQMAYRKKRKTTRTFTKRRKKRRNYY